MKGSILDYIRSIGARIISASKIGYATRYEIGDLANDDLVTKYLLLNNGGGVTPPDGVEIIASTTPSPLVVAYPGTATTRYLLTRTDGDRAPIIDNQTPVGYDGSNFTIYGDQNNDGTFAQSFIFQILP